ncbi:MAG: HAD family phosphatase [Chloroflexi bacterium]|nr:HAD family phosphatase [Chloroflexota bacterium]
MPCSAVVFDLDGVVADTESIQLKAFNLVLKPYGIEISEHEWATVYVGTPVEQDVAAAHARYNLPVSLETMASERRATYSKLIQTRGELEPSDGLVELLQFLQAREILTAIASASPRVDVSNVLQRLEIAPFFRVVVTSDDVRRSKPAPDVYLHAAAGLGVSPGDCFAVEDSASGMLAAKAAGMTVIGFPSRFTRHQDLKSDFRISELSQVRAIVSEATPTD